VNYCLIDNKDGKYAWRQFEIIHPLIYFYVVYCITRENSWETICTRFEEFQSNHCNIQCLSLPVKPTSTEKTSALQVQQWWHHVELKSIEYALDYEYMFHTDVVDCYPSIYTHSIAWALHGKETAKTKRRDAELIGNKIDLLIQDMRCGQTNGIPQGSVLMNLIAEMVLGYADIRLAEKPSEDRIKKETYQILRYRDDYRIFTENPLVGEKIIRCLSEVMTTLGMKLHAQKTKSSDQLIRSSIKSDKLAWVARKQHQKDLLKHLLIIHDHGTAHMNSGSLVKALSEFRHRLNNVKGYQRGVQLISIAVDIAYRNPRTYPQVASIISKCFEFLNNGESRIEITNRIRRKFSTVANTGLMDIWLQRICTKDDDEIDFEEPLCKLVSGKRCQIWNSDWIKNDTVTGVITPESILDKNCIETMSPIIQSEEIDLFPPYG